MDKLEVAPIPKEELEEAVRRLCYRIAAAIINRMADTNMTFKIMAVRLDKPADELRKLLFKLVEGETISLSAVSDFATAMGCELQFGFIPNRPGVEQAVGDGK